MIDPPPAGAIGPITAFMPSQQPTAFTSRMCRKSVERHVSDGGELQHARVVDQHVEPT